MEDIRDRRAAENENLFRRVNERVEELSRGLSELPLICECAAAGCAERLPAVPAVLYERVRRNPRWFFVRPGHERRDVESVVEDHRGFLVVEKEGVAGETARDDDPRSA